MITALAWIVAGLYVLVNLIGAAEGVNPLHDRPKGYLVAGFVMEIALIALLISVLA